MHCAELISHKPSIIPITPSSLSHHSPLAFLSPNSHLTLTPHSPLPLHILLTYYSHTTHPLLTSPITPSTFPSINSPITSPVYSPN